MRKRQKNSDEQVNIGVISKKAVFRGGGGITHDTWIITEINHPMLYSKRCLWWHDLHPAPEQCKHVNRVCDPSFHIWMLETKTRSKKGLEKSILVRFSIQRTGPHTSTKNIWSMCLAIYRSIDLSRITLQWPIKKWGHGLGGQFHTNHCIVSTRASSWCLCLQECGKGLLILSVNT